MSKGVDVYQQCPCGSGKKIKFCCHTVVEDMAYVFELMNDGKFPAARAILEPTRKRAEATGGQTLAWVLSVLGSVEITEGKYQAAGTLADEAIAACAENPDGHLLKTLVQLQASDFDGARKSFDAAFRHVKSVPALAIETLIRLAGEFAERRHLLAVRACLSGIAVCEQGREQAVRQLRRFDSDGAVPYPFRAPLPLRPAPADAPWRATAREGIEFHSRMAFYAAAEKFREVVEKVPDSGMFFNLGLSLASIGNDRQAALSFRRSALLDDDYERAVDTEALAQLLEFQTVLPPEESVNTEYRASSFDDLDAKLDSLPRCAPVPTEPDPRTGALPPFVRYLVLNRAPAEGDLDLPLAEQPQVCGQVALFRQNAAGEQTPLVYYTEHDHIGEQSAKGWFETECGGLVEATGNVTRDKGQAREYSPLVIRAHQPEDISYAAEERRRAEEFAWLRDTAWPSLKLTALGGRTPVEAKEKPEFKIPLAASILVLDAFCTARGFAIDEGALRETLGLPAVTPIVPDAGSPDNRVWTPLEVRRMDVSRLSEVALSRLLYSMALLGNARLDIRVCGELLSRAKASNTRVPQEFRHMLARGLRAIGRRDEALAAIEEGRGAVSAFREQVELDLLEMSVRATDPADPQLELIAYRVWHQYVPKLPDQRDMLVAMLSMYLPKGPWAGGLDLSGTVSIPETGAVTAGGIWTPEATDAPAGGGSKLWVPGS